MTSLVDPCDVEGEWRGQFESGSCTLKVSIHVEPATCLQKIFRIQPGVAVGFSAKVCNKISGGTQGRMESGKGVVITKPSKRSIGFYTTLMFCDGPRMRVESQVMSMVSRLILLARVSPTELSATYTTYIKQDIPSTMILTKV